MTIFIIGTRYQQIWAVSNPPSPLAGCGQPWSETAMTLKEARETVIAYYPLAHAVAPSATSQTGQSAVYDKTAWAVFAMRDLGSQPIGTGPTQEAAWIAAAKTVQVHKRRAAMQRWVDYL